MTLHSLACRGWAECRCAVVYRVRETASNVRSIYNERTEGDSVEHAIESRRLGARDHPPAPGRSATSRVIR